MKDIYFFFQLIINVQHTAVKWCNWLRGVCLHQMDCQTSGCDNTVPIRIYYINVHSTVTKWMCALRSHNHLHCSQTHLELLMELAWILLQVTDQVRDEHPVRVRELIKCCKKLHLGPRTHLQREKDLLILSLSSGYLASLEHYNCVCENVFRNHTNVKQHNNIKISISLWPSVRRPTSL